MLLPGMAVWVTILSAVAQQSGQPIIFSSPQNGGSQPGTSSLPPNNSQPGILPGTLQAPVNFFDFTPPSDVLPSPVLPADSPQQRRMKKMFEDRKNWNLMTPEEILGTTTSEKMSQTPELDALGREKNQTQLERYLERENRLRAGPTNIWQNDRASSSWNSSRDLDNASSLDSGRNNSVDTAKSLGQFFSGQPNQNGATAQNGNTGWAAFSQPSPQNTTKPDLEQMAAMERFRQLLSPSPAETAKSSPDSQFFSASKPAADPFMTQPDSVPNSAGLSFAPLSTGISKPAGLAPLPTMTTSFSLPSIAPVGQLQPPPWLLLGPQPFVMPQRKF